MKLELHIHIHHHDDAALSRVEHQLQEIRMNTQEAVDQVNTMSAELQTVKTVLDKVKEESTHAQEAIASLTAALNDALNNGEVPQALVDAINGAATATAAVHAAATGVDDVVPDAPAGGDLQPGDPVGGGADTVTANP